MGLIERLPHFDDSFIIPHVTDARGLLLRVDDGWALPRWRRPAGRGRAAREFDDPFWPAAIQRELRHQLGIDVTTLHAEPYDERDPQTGDRRTVFVLENHRVGWVPPSDAKWIGRDEMDDLSLVDSVERAALLAWFAELESGLLTSHRQVWQRAHWFSTAWRWVQTMGAATGGGDEPQMAVI